MSADDLAEGLSSRERLLDWFQMSDDDQAVAVLYAWRHHQDPNTPARVRYVVSTQLQGLTPDAAAHHALHVTGGWHGLEERLDQDERDRLYHRGLELDGSPAPGA